MKEKLKNKFFDINRLPKEEGLLIFPISMSRISNSQNGSKYFDIINDFAKKLARGVVGVTFIYTDNLYEKYVQMPKISTNKYLELMIAHKNQFIKNLRKKSTFVECAFDFISWTQIMLEAINFTSKLDVVKKIYKKDKIFQKYVKEDIKANKKGVTQNNINFILEEILLTYLISKEEIKISNALVNGRDKWRLICYPGKPLKSLIYFYQKNIFNLNSGNPHENSIYDLTNKKLYNPDNTDLETFKF